MAKTKPSKTFTPGQAVQVRGVGRIDWSNYTYVKVDGVRHAVTASGTGGWTRSVPDGRIRAKESP